MYECMTNLWKCPLHNHCFPVTEKESSAQGWQKLYEEKCKTYTFQLLAKQIGSKQGGKTRCVSG